MMERLGRRTFLKSLGLTLGGLLIPSGELRGEKKYFNWLNDNPPSLMLHSKDYRQIPDLIPLIKEFFTPMTYKKWLRVRDYIDVTFDTLVAQYGERRVLNPFYPDFYHFILFKPPLVISIDDVGTDWIRKEHLEIFRLLSQASIPGVIGLQPNQEVSGKDRYWNIVRDLHSAGWEIASHTITHSDLPSVSRDYLLYEIAESSRRIAEGVGEAPISLIVPFGDLYPGKQFLEEDRRIYEVANQANYKLVVGILGGRNRDQRSPEYIGRVPPGPSAQVTLQYLQNFDR